MQTFEYKVVAAPRKAKRAKGARTPKDRFARTLTDVINAEAREGWEYLRAESLPVDEKKSMLSSPTEAYHAVLVFRKAVSNRYETHTESIPKEDRVSAPQKAQPQGRKTPPKPSPLTLGPADRSDQA